jgi:hypothetical protein
MIDFFDRDQCLEIVGDGEVMGSEEKTIEYEFLKRMDF